MNVEEDGHLCLHMCDLVSDDSNMAASRGETPRLCEFSVEARIAAAYANRAGYPITFVCPGQGVRTIEPEGYYFSVKKVKPVSYTAKPVPQWAVGKCVGHFPAMRILRKVGERFVVANRASSIASGDIWQKVKRRT